MLKNYIIDSKVLIKSWRPRLKNIECSQRNFARILGKHHAYIFRVLDGKTVPRFNFVVKAEKKLQELEKKHEINTKIFWLENSTEIIEK